MDSLLLDGNLCNFQNSHFSLAFVAQVITSPVHVLWERWLMPRVEWKVGNMLKGLRQNKAATEYVLQLEHITWINCGRQMLLDIFRSLVQALLHAASSVLYEALDFLFLSLRCSFSTISESLLSWSLARCRKPSSGRCLNYALND